MTKSKFLFALPLALVGAGLSVPAAAQSGYYNGNGYYDARGDRGYYNEREARRAERQERRAERRYRQSQTYYNNGYDNRGYDDRRVYQNGYRCDRGTGGTIIGAVAGGLIGNEVARRGDKTVGTIIGGAVGAIAGRAIDKGNDGCRR